MLTVIEKTKKRRDQRRNKKQKEQQSSHERNCSASKYVFWDKYINNVYFTDYITVYTFLVATSFFYFGFNICICFF